MHHVPNYDRGSSETFAMVGASFLPEVLDFIVKGTIYDAAASVKDATLASLSIGSLELVPAFRPAVTQYEAYTTNATDTITVAAKDSATWAEGKNTVTVTVTNSPATKVYTVEVTANPS